MEFYVESVFAESMSRASKLNGEVIHSIELVERRTFVFYIVRFRRGFAFLRAFSNSDFIFTKSRGFAFAVYGSPSLHP